MPTERGTVVFVEYESRILEGNPLRDPHVRRFPVYLPPEYATKPDKRFPVLFALTGFTSSGVMYLNKRFLTPALDELLDRLIADGMPGAICVLPDCLTYYGGSQYVNSSAVGNYQDYIVQELVPLIDRQFRTTGRRGCFGGSSGGIGSFTLAASRPDIFQAFADHSGDSGFESCYLNDIPKFVQAMEKYDYDIKKFTEAIPTIQPKDDQFMCILNLVAMSACYSPNPEAKPLGFELPCDPYTGELNPAVWNKWLAHDPVRMVEPYKDNLRKLKCLFVDCGRKDQFHLYLGARQLHQRLDRFGIAHVYEEYDSDHFLLRREQERKSIPMIVAALVD